MDKLTIEDLQYTVDVNEKKIQDLIMFNDGCKMHIKLLIKKRNEVNYPKPVVYLTQQRQPRQRSVDRYDRYNKKQKIYDDVESTETIVERCVKCDDDMFISLAQQLNLKKKGYVLPKVCKNCKNDRT